MIKNMASLLTLSAALVAGPVQAKELTKKYGTVVQGKLPTSTLQQISVDAEAAQRGMTQAHYEEVIANPLSARNEGEKLAGLCAREYFILVDRSGSMKVPDQNPTGIPTAMTWTRWDSARVAAESIAELALSLDADNRVEIMLWDGDPYLKLRPINMTMSSLDQLAPLFNNHKPESGNTPLHTALEEIYQSLSKTFFRGASPLRLLS